MIRAQARPPSVIVDGVINALSFGLSPDNEPSQNVAALNDATAYAAGKELYIPAGYYLVDGTINIPDGTVIRGAGGQNLFDPTGAGTVFGVMHTDAPVFSTLNGVIIDGINFWWPDQVTTSPPVEYDYAIYSDLSLGTTGGLTIKNVVMYNAYKMINLQGDYTDGSPATNLVRLEHVYGCALHTGIYQCALRTEATVLECNISPVWWIAGADSDALKWMMTDGVACYHLGGGQGLQFTGGTFFGHRRGIYGSNPLATPNGNTFLKVTGMILDGMSRCIETADNIGFRGAEFTGCTFLGSDRYNTGTSTSRGFLSNDCNVAQIIKFVGCEFLGTEGHHVEIVAPTSTATSAFTFTGCYFYAVNSNSQAGTFYNVYCDDTRARLVIEGGEVTNPILPGQVQCFRIVNAATLSLTDVVIMDTASQAFNISSAATYATINGIYSRSTVASAWPTSGQFSIASASSIRLWEWDVPYVVITGTTTITDIAMSWPGRVTTLKFTSANCSVTDGGVINLNNDFTSAAGDTLTLACDGAAWFEVARSNAANRISNTFTGAQTIAQGTLTASAPSLTMTQTWNNAGVDFIGMSFSATDTASGASTTLARFTVDGVTRLNLAKTGTLTQFGNLGVGFGVSTEARSLSIGANRTGDGACSVDLISDTTYTAGGFRSVRSAGENGNTTLTHRGTGTFGLAATEAAPISMTTGGSSALYIDPARNVVLNNGSIATTATDGFLYVPACAGTPTGTPTVYGGRVPIVFDTTNNKLYFYSSGSWRDAGP